MNNRSDTVRKTVVHVIMTIAALFGLELIMIAFFAGGGISVWDQQKLKLLLGLTAGSLIGVGMFLHMKKSIEESLAFGEKSASGQIRKSYAVRMSVVGILMILAAWSGWFDILTLILGIMNLKIAAYIQPILHKIFHRKEDTR